MFTTPAPATTTISTSTSQALPSSPTRPSRLRGLSYLRNYTSIHSQTGNTSRPQLPRAHSSPSPDTGDQDLTSETQPHEAGVASTANMPRGSATAATARGSRTSHRSSSRQQSSNEVPTTARIGRNRMESGASSRNQNAVNGAVQDEQSDAAKSLPSIRFIPHHDPRAPRPSLSFSTISRTLPEETSIIRVGRYSERDNLPDIPLNVPSSAPVGFKSKVVSRRHCEFWYSDGRWWIKDVKSSSGTFLNHIRLSQPGVESRPYEVKDGDVVQLGIDFRGGEEMIFRCVKIRVECNRGWQQGLNSFNKSTHAHLRKLAKPKKDTDSGSTHTSECSICLMSIAPCQSLFVAPCSHVWHYKCIRPILQGPTAPTFLCPNCRAVTDLEADVDEPAGFSDSASEVDEANEQTQHVLSNGHGTEIEQTTPRNDTANGVDGAESAADASTAPPAGAEDPSEENILDEAGLHDAMERVSIQDELNHSDDSDSPAETTVATTTAVSQPLPIGNIAIRGARGLSPSGLGGPVLAPECPMTPRNDAGPFVLDGSAGRLPPLPDTVNASGEPNGSPATRIEESRQG